MLKEKMAYYHGRFQPFHLGHYEIVKYALERHKNLIIGISNPFRSRYVKTHELTVDEVISFEKARNPDNNPWPFWARLLMIREGLSEEGVDLSRIIIIPNVSNTSEPRHEIEFPKEMITVYLCPKEAHNIKKYKEYIDAGWDIIRIPIKKNMISSGIIRDKIRLSQDWEQYVLKGTASVIKKLNSEKILCFM